MKLLDNILLGLDFSKSSQNTLESAITLAKTFESKITPIHVFPHEFANEKVEKLFKETTSEKLSKSIQLIKENNIETGEALIRKGSPVEAISKATSLTHSSILVIGAGDTSEIDNFKLGTTTTRIIQKSEKPVFVIKENIPLNIKKIICPVDFSSTSKRALTNAIIIAKKFKAKLDIISVCEIENSSWILSAEALETENLARIEKHTKKFQEFLKDFQLGGLDWKQETLKGNPAQEILTAISKNQADLLVIGTSGKTGLNKLIIGSVTEKVIREVPCSFLTLKSEDAFSLKLETSIKDLEQHYEAGLNFAKDGFYEEAIDQFKACLQINNMHITSYFEISKVFEELKMTDEATIYKQAGLELKEKIWYSKIEEEVRKLRGS